MVITETPARDTVTQPAQGIGETATLAADTATLPAEAIARTATLLAVTATMSLPPRRVRRGWIQRTGIGPLDFRHDLYGRRAKMTKPKET